MEPSVTLQSVTESAQQIQKLLTERFDHYKAEETTEKLYQAALLILKGHSENKPLFPETILPVVLILNDVVCLDSIQNLDSLNRALSKTYRVFIELSWYQCWKQQERLTSKDTVEKIRSNCSKMLGILPQNEMLARFEYQCTEQAVRLLKPTEPIWHKYLTLLPKAASAGANLSIEQGLDVLIKLVQFAQRDWLKSWYPEVHYMRWMSVSLRSTAEFHEAVGNKLEQFIKEGKKYTDCLAIIYLDYLKDQSLGKEFRQFAGEQLSELLLLEDREQVSRIFSILSKKSEKHGGFHRFFGKVKSHAKSTSEKLKEKDRAFKEKIHYQKGSFDSIKKLPRKISSGISPVFKSVAQQADRYWKTRLLIMSQLEGIYQEKLYHEYLNPCIHSLASILARPQKDKLRAEIEAKFREFQNRTDIDPSALNQAYDQLVGKKEKGVPSDEGGQEHSFVQTLEGALEQINNEEIARVKQIYDLLKK